MTWKPIDDEGLKGLRTYLESTKFSPDDPRIDSLEDCMGLIARLDAAEAEVKWLERRVQALRDEVDMNACDFEIPYGHPKHAENCRRCGPLAADDAVKDTL